MDEILYELKDHSAGLNCGRWDYIFSFIKTVRNHNERIFPDRDQVTMTSHCMKSYSELLIYTCHKRGAHAMGGMAAQIPIKNDEDANSIAIKKVREDKLREVLLGHDGTWVAHPGLIDVAREIFDSYMPHSNQIDDSKGNKASREDLLRVPLGSISEKGLSHNLSVGIQYIESWLRGNGCVPLYNLMEDAATAEISRTQVWQWRKHNCSVESGETIDVHMINKKISEVLESIEKEVGSDRFNSGKFDESVSLFREMVFLDELPKFLTIDAYEHIK
jgi:malate synthase